MAFLILLLSLLSLASLSLVASDRDACGRNFAPYTPEESQEDFLLQQLLMKGFKANDVNKYSIRKGGFTPDGGKRQCITVHYNIECGENTTAICNRSECDSQKSSQPSNNNCNPDEHIILWTVFDGATATGNTLLKLIVLDLRVFGFELCDVYIDPIDVNITLDHYEPAPQSYYDLNTALTEFTTLVRKFMQ